MLLMTTVPAFAITGPGSTNISIVRNITRRVVTTGGCGGTIVQNVVTTATTGGNINSGNTTGGTITTGNATAISNVYAYMNISRIVIR